MPVVRTYVSTIIICGSLLLASQEARSLIWDEILEVPLNKIIADQCDDGWALDKLKLQIYGMARDPGLGDEQIHVRWLSIMEFLHRMQNIHDRHAADEYPWFSSTGAWDSFRGDQANIGGSLDILLDRADQEYSLFLMRSYFNAGVVFGNHRVCTQRIVSLPRAILPVD